jgi:hypothetical protein
MLRHAPIAAILAALALPAAATAKEISSLAVCGPAACHTVKADRAALRGFLEGGYETTAPKSSSAFFEVKAKITHEGQDAGGFTVQYARAFNLIRAEAEFGKHRWLRPADVTARALRRAARGLRPYPAEKLAPVREPSPAPAENPPARESSAASGGGSSRLGLAGGAGALLVALGAAAVAMQRRRHAI